MKAAIGLGLLCSFLIGAGHVQTRDAKVYRGNVTLDQGALLVQPVEGGESVRLGIDEIQTAVLRDFEPQRLAGSEQERLPKPWASADIGQVHMAGSAVCDESGMLTLEASGWGVLGNADSFHWAYRPLDGDGQILVHVRSVDQSHGPFVVGVMMRPDLKPDSNMAVTCLDPDDTVRLDHRAGGEAPALGNVVPSGAKEAVWLRLARRGDTFTAYCSTDGQTWRRVDRRTVPMPPQVLAGVAVWGTGNSSRGRAVVDSVSVIPGTAGTSFSLTETDLERGIVLQDGTVRAGAILAIDDKALTLENGRKRTLIPRDELARVILSAPAISLKDLAGKTGVLLKNGDFVEGDVTALAASVPPDSESLQGKISVSSLIFGSKDIDLREAVAILIRIVTPSSARCRVKLADGSLLQGNTVDIRKNGLFLDGTAVTDVVSIEVRR